MTGVQTCALPIWLFTFVFLSAVAFGIALSLVGSAFMGPFLGFMGAEGGLVDLSVQYGRILFFALPFFILQNVFQSFFVAAEKPHVGLAVIVAGGLTNIALDYAFIGVFGWGVVGAALATAAGQALAAIVPIVYFATSRTSRLRLAKPAFEIGRAHV